MDALRSAPTDEIDGARDNEGDRNNDGSTRTSNQMKAGIKESSMVFVNTAENAVELSRRLRERGVRCVEFHRLVSPLDRDAALQDFREGRVGVLVCTDAAAR
jgi:superfamily II DNA/RNA helicase